MHRHLSCHATTSIVMPLPVSSRLSCTVAGCHFPLVVVVIIITIMMIVVVVIIVVVG